MQHLPKMRLQHKNDGATFPYVIHGGKAYFAVESGEQYEIKIDLGYPGSRREVIVSVDGRDTLKNEPADYNRFRGLVTDDSEIVIKGWRISSSEVKAFVAASLGNGQTVSEKNAGAKSSRGTIAAAIFGERVARSFMPVLESAGLRGTTRGGFESNASGDAGLENMRSFGATMDSMGLDEDRPRGGGLLGITRGATRGGSAGGASAGAYRKSSPAPAPSIGTAAGQTITDHVGTTRFERFGMPELLEIEYDSKANLIDRGIWPAETSKGWPGMPDPRFCDPSKL